MAKTTRKPLDFNATVSMNKAEWTRFKKKCQKAGSSAAARVRELIAQDLKV